VYSYTKTLFPALAGR